MGKVNTIILESQKLKEILEWLRLESHYCSLCWDKSLKDAQIIYMNEQFLSLPLDSPQQQQTLKPNFCPTSRNTSLRKNVGYIISYRRASYIRVF